MQGMTHLLRMFSHAAIKKNIQPTSHLHNQKGKAQRTQRPLPMIMMWIQIQPSNHHDMMG
jgi:hypothetical protein